MERNRVAVTAGDVRAAGDLKLAETLLVDADAEVAHDELDADTGEDIADAVLEQGEELTSSPTMKYAACRPRMAKTVEV